MTALASCHTCSTTPTRRGLCGRPTSLESAASRCATHYSASTSECVAKSTAASRRQPTWTPRRGVATKALFDPPPFKPEKLAVLLAAGTSSLEPAPPRSRKYTLTHNDITGNLRLTIGADYNQQQISGFYTRLLRDEVIAEWVAVGASGYALHVYCHVSGEERWLAPPLLRNYIFRREMPLVLDTIVYADRQLLQRQPELARAQVYIHFQSSVRELDTVEYWGLLGERSTWPKGPTSILLRTIYAIIGWPPYLEALPADLSIDLPDEVRDLEEAVRWQQQQRQQGPRQEGLRQEGRQEARQEGRQEGRQEARQEGRQEGRQEAWQEGWQDGWQEGRQEVEQLLRQERRKAERGREARERDREAERAREREPSAAVAGTQALARAEAAVPVVEPEEDQQQPQQGVPGAAPDARQEWQRQAASHGAAPVQAAAPAPPTGSYPHNGAPASESTPCSAGTSAGEEAGRWPGRSSTNGAGVLRRSGTSSSSSSSGNGLLPAASQAPVNGYSLNGSAAGRSSLEAGGLNGVAPGAGAEARAYERRAAPTVATAVAPCAASDGQPCSGGPGCSCDAADQAPEVPGRATPAAVASAGSPVGLPAALSVEFSAAAELLVGTGSRAVARSSAS
ncbi:hypothetical protein CHLRE_12g487500v5 [Chlamydomonas reinhardtii]|uniref:Staygreen protein domain-containing protein n=1 Tax=Chlamydomonas reinhardtii TaxID=3055 RepID=A0A2K3D2C6_CHLRE|nr:uncharacterized protein CHLRE_12g487500v5 [Chlamydomonas reinhardtii]PNW74675.1 hypothetical protein CHLRE_12g487500v5 [Chlamydomonas reinhardtii]